MKWLQASNNIVEIEPFSVCEHVILNIVLIFKAKELNLLAQLNSLLE